MDISLIIAIGTMVAGAMAWAIKALISRLDEMQRQITNKVTEPELRQILDDKIVPIKESMADVKMTVDKAYDLLIKKANE